jgi:hypothetical protein
MTAGLLQSRNATYFLDIGDLDIVIKRVGHSIAAYIPL